MIDLTSGEQRAPSPRLFIVYASEDEWFVKGFLLPALGLLKEEVLLSTELELGAPVVKEIASGAVSPVTVVVMSPSFLDCSWATFASQLATHQSVERSTGSSSVVVSARLVDCDVPLYSEFKVSLDFRSPARWEDEAARLRKKLAAYVPAREVVRCPYPGMLAFEEKAAADFYGREVEILQALTYVEAGTRELYVIGSSGSGKSSLVAAGALPALQRAGEHGGARYLVRKLRPGVDPLAALSIALEVPAEDKEPDKLQGAVSGLLARNPEHQRVLLFVDQLEELFTTSKTAAREAFEQALLQLRREERVVTLLTLRADFYGELINSPLWEGSDRAPMRLDVKPLRGTCLRAAIEQPARRLGVYFEPVLVERLLQEVQHEAGALPLLQDALVQLWRDRTRGVLRLADYEGKGTEGQTGLAARVQHRADTALYELTLTQRQLARRVLLRMVQFAESDAEVVTRRQQTRAALAAAGDDEDEVNAVIRHLAARRLLTTSKGEEQDGWPARFDLAHEVLLTAWPTLKAWIQTRREDEQRRRVLEGKATEWVRNGRGKTRLLDAEELAEAHGWLMQEAAYELGPSQEMLELVRASEMAEAEKAAAFAELERQRRQAESGRLAVRRRLLRAVFQGLLMVLLLVLLLGLVLWEQWKEAQDLRQQTREGAKVAKEELAEAREEREVVQRNEWEWFLERLKFKLQPVFMTLRSQIWRATLFRGDRVRFAIFSPDGSRVVTASEDKTAQVWEVTTGRPFGRPLRHQGAIWDAAFSPDGTRVVTASEDKTAQVWLVASGQPFGAPLKHRDGIWAAAFSPNGAYVVTASEDNTARVWEVAKSRVVAELEHEGAVWDAAFSPDSARVVTASEDNTARVWVPYTGQFITELRHGGGVWTAAFSPNSDRIVTASVDGTAQVWEASTGRPIGGQLTHKGFVYSAAFSPDGACIVTASEDKTAQVWEVASGRISGAPLQHQGGVWTAVFSPDGARVITSSYDQAARVWNINANPVEAPRLHQGAWIAANQPIGVPLRHGRGVRSATFSPDGARVVTTSYDQTAQIWEAFTGLPVGAPLRHHGFVYNAAFSPDGMRVVTASDDQTAQVWEVATGLPIGAPLRHQGRVWAATFSPDGTRVVTGSEDQTAQVWEVATSLPVGAILRHQGGVWSAIFSPDGTRVVTASQDKTARVWEVGTSQQVGIPLQHDGEVRSATFSPDGARVVTASEDHTARVWKVSTGRPLGVALKHQGRVWTAAFSPDGARVVTASEDHTARIWDAATSRLLSVFLDHQGEVRGAAFSSDGARVVTASEDRTARVWEVGEDGKQMRLCSAKMAFLHCNGGSCYVSEKSSEN